MKSVIAFFEESFYSPKAVHKAVSVLMLPFSLLYCAINCIRFFLCREKRRFGIPIISVGNLTVGGSGKTPVSIALAKRYENSAVVLRGYGRKSRGVVVVSDSKKLMCDVEVCGDEALAIAKESGKIVIVSEKREDGIQKAVELGADVVILDDAFGKCIKKLEILIDSSAKNRFCLPAGPYRFLRYFLRFADIVLKEGRDFTREVYIENETDDMVLVTSIANPSRLDRYIKKNIKKYRFADHHLFTKEEIENIVKRERPKSLLVTVKDMVKLEKFGYDLSVMRLEIKFNQNILRKIDEYVNSKGEI